MPVNYRTAILLSSHFLPHGTSNYVTLWKMDIINRDYNEFGDIVEFIRDALVRIKHDGRGLLKKFASKNKIDPAELTKFMNYDRNSKNIHLLSAYRILRALLDRPPIDIAQNNDETLFSTKINYIKKSDYRELYDLLFDVLNNCEYADPNQIKAQLDDIKSSLKIIRTGLLAIKERPREECGESASNYGETMKMANERSIK